MTYQGSGAAYKIATELLVALTAKFQTGTLGGIPPRVCIVPGEIAWDECGETCGMLAIASSRFYPSTIFPEEDNTSSANCGSAPFLALEFVVQILRCAPTPDARGNAPSCDALDAAAQVVLDDAYQVVCAVTQQLDFMIHNTEIEDYTIRQQLFSGPEGGCVGSNFEFTVGIMR